MKDLEELLVGVVGELERRGIRYMVIGGIAAARWGLPRATFDIDVTLLADDDQVIQAAEALGSPIVDDPTAFLERARMIPVSLADGTMLDLMAATIPYELAAVERARDVDIAGRAVKFVTPEDLIIHKVISERPHDYQDVEGVMRRQRGALDFDYMDPIVRGFSIEMERPEILERYEAAKRLAGS